MKPEYLGDAKDFAKGFLFSWLRNKRLICGPMVLPFFTCSDADLENASVIKTYSAILGIAQTSVLSHQAWPCSIKHRENYINLALENVNDGDTVFLDPDTGVRPRLYSKTRSSKNKYVVTFEDILKVVDCDQDRIAIVYDESYSNAVRSYERLSEAVQDKLMDLLSAGEEKKVTGFAYVGMALNLLFVGNEKAAERVVSIADEMTQLLCGSEKRIIRSDKLRIT